MFAFIPPRPGTSRLSSSLLALAVLLAAAPAALGQAEVGFYWDDGHTQVQTEVAEFPAFVPAYLVVRGVPQGILGWELRADIDGPGSYVGWSLEGQTINVATEPNCFSVGLAQPLPDTPDGILVASVQVMVTEARPVILELMPWFRPTIPGEMAYLPADDPDHPQVLATVTGDRPVAWINADAPWAEVTPPGLNFDACPTGMTTVRDVVVTNAGGGVLQLDVSLPATCEGFSLPGLSGPVLVSGGESRTIAVGFQPQDNISYDCDLDLGNGIPSVHLFGTGRDPVTSWAVPEAVYFDTTVIGYSKYRSVVVRNTGETDLPLEASLVDGVPGLSITSGGGPVVLAPGLSHTVGITFTPTIQGAFDVQLDLGAVLPRVRLWGNARYPETSWSISPTALHFNTTAVGYTREASVRIVNTGDTVIDGDAAFVGDHEGFEIFDNAGPFTLYAGQSRYVWVRFAPQEIRIFEATLSLGPLYQTVPVIGAGDLYNENCSINPAALDFGSVNVGSSRYLTFEVQNPGTAPLSVNPTLSSQHFSLQSNPRTIQPGQSAWYTVTFRPQAAGTFTAEVDPGSGTCSPVHLTGRGLGNVQACATMPDTLVFGPVNLGQSASQLLYVENTGDLRLDLAPESSSPMFTVAGGLRQLQSGQSTSFNVTFTPQEAGTTTATLTLGGPCEPVVLVGQAITGFEPWENLVGVFFDQDYTQAELVTEVPDQEVTGYLVLHNPSEPSGVGAWELEARVTGPGTILEWQIEGNYINVGQYNELIVGVGGSPLLPDASGAVLLASFNLLVEEPFPSEVTLQIGPITNASLPGLMAWVPWDDAELLLPMIPHTGIETVGWINNNALPVQDVPAPLALVQDGVVSLQWTRPEGPDLAFNVYRRRGDDDPVRLTDRPLRGTGSVLVYEDRPEGFAPGTVLHYRYALVENGTETLYSPETAVTVTGIPALASRLLPNVPNPFNPSTRVRFELSRTERVRVAVFDLAGRRLRTLVDGVLGPGPHEKVWDGRDDAGRTAPSGSYYVRLVSDSRVDHRKVMLLK